MGKLLNFAKEIEQVIFCLADILREEEMRCSHTEKPIKDMLVLLESQNDAKRLKEELLKIETNAKEPELILN